MIDPGIASQRDLVWGITTSAVLTSILISGVTLNMLDGAMNFSILRVNGNHVKAGDVIISGYSTILAIMLRNVYRRREALEAYGTHSTTVRCLTYRCSASLWINQEPVDPVVVSVAASVVLRKLSSPTASFVASAKIVPMKCEPVILGSSTNPYILPIPHRLSYRGRISQVLVWCTIVVGITLTIISLVPSASSACRWSSLIITTCFCLLCGSLYLRSVLRYLVWSFDFAFLSIQLTMIHLCMCDLFAWDGRVLAVGSSWLWVHWLLMLDCLPSAVKSAWQLRYRWVACVAMLFVLAHVAVVCQLVFGRREALRDRAVLSFVLLDHVVKLRVLATMVGRMLVTFGWSCRVVWRLWHRGASELLFIEGTVTYVNNRKELKRYEDRLKYREKKEGRVSTVRVRGRGVKPHGGPRFAVGVKKSKLSVVPIKCSH
ncbi:hypothetical protein Poli38472_003477 [Pythium oligandrum]|uniref:Uncharacterized protein n=1 Tax=Pythium oligandrum TaxID=41045 RepID=A0A8K1C7Q2_PYTOL|nr:hypothetical protein Poli38472_003477 [Pythium oligandrum]|eukprot:TMW57552.1 hypothetical protein Poli38472_003477 [Pythium oligandrum]